MNKRNIEQDCIEYLYDQSNNYKVRTRKEQKYGQFDG